VIELVDHAVVETEIPLSVTIPVLPKFWPFILIIVPTLPEEG
jgi:hypothetical protein